MDDALTRLSPHNGSAHPRPQGKYIGRDGPPHRRPLGRSAGQGRPKFA